MSDSGDSHGDLDEVILDNMSKQSKQKRPRPVVGNTKPNQTSGTAALLSADSELSASSNGPITTITDNSNKKGKKNRRTHITSEKYGIGRFVGLHTPIQMRTKRTEAGTRQEEKRRMCIYCGKRIYTMCKECNTAVCFASTFENAEECCWYLHHHESSMVHIPSSLHATL